MFDWQNFGVSSITEPNQSQSNDWSSIGFDYRTFARCTLYYFRATCGKPQGNAIEWDKEVIDRLILGCTVSPICVFKIPFHSMKMEIYAKLKSA